MVKEFVLDVLLNQSDRWTGDRRCLGMPTKERIPRAMHMEDSQDEKHAYRVHLPVRAGLGSGE
jgi:hypothetical protein